MNVKKLNFDEIVVEVTFYCIVDATQYDLGSLQMECEGRKYVLDVSKTMVYDENNFTRFACDLVVDEETFPANEHLYDLTEDDFYNPNFKATLYIGQEYEVEPEFISLFVTRNGSCQAIDVSVD